MSNLWICLIPSSPFLIYGIVMLVTAHRYKSDIRLCTEAVNTRILSLEKQKTRYGYKYIYQVCYSRQGEQFTPSFKTREYLGEIGENATLYIDPSNHKRYLLPDASARITYHMMSGIVFLAIGLIVGFAAVADILNS